MAWKEKKIAFPGPSLYQARARLAALDPEGGKSKPSETYDDNIAVGFIRRGK